MADETTISYALYPNSATVNRQDDFYARPVGIETLDEKDLIEDAALRDGRLDAETLRQAWEALSAAVVRLTGKGKALRTRLFSTDFSLPGKITAGALADEPGAEDESSRPRKVRVNVQASPELRAAAASLRTRRVQAPDTGPAIDVIVNDVNGEVNSTLSLGGPVTVTGHHIAIRGQAPEVGVYLLTTSDSRRVKVASRLIENEPSRLVFLVPASGIPAGEYVRIALVSQYTTGRRELKTPRTYECPIYLEVLAA